MGKNKKSTGSKAFNIIEGIVIALLILLIAFMLFLYFSFSKTGAAPSVFGYNIYYTKAVNMQPAVMPGSAVIASRKQIDEIKKGSIILCTSDDNTILTRVTELLNEDGRLYYIVRFDTAREDDTFKIPTENVIAKAVYTSAPLGALLGFATSTLGILLVIIIPSLLIIVLQVVRILGMKRAEEDARSLDDLTDIMRSEDQYPENVFFNDEYTGRTEENGLYTLEADSKEVTFSGGAVFEDTLPEAYSPEAEPSPETPAEDTPAAAITADNFFGLDTPSEETASAEEENIFSESFAEETASEPSDENDAFSFTANTDIFAEEKETSASGGMGFDIFSGSDDERAAEPARAVTDIFVGATGEAPAEEAAEAVGGDIFAEKAPERHNPLSDAYQDTLALLDEKEHAADTEPAEAQAAPFGDVLFGGGEEPAAEAVTAEPDVFSGEMTQETAGEVLSADITAEPPVSQPLPGNTTELHEVQAEQRAEAAPAAPVRTKKKKKKTGTSVEDLLSMIDNDLK